MKAVPPIKMPPYWFQSEASEASRRLQEAVEAVRRRYEAMTPEQQKAMWQAQKESFVRGMTTPCEHGMLDFEQCGECRSLAGRKPHDG